MLLKTRSLEMRRKTNRFWTLSLIFFKFLLDLGWQNIEILKDYVLKSISHLLDFLFISKWLLLRLFFLFFYIFLWIELYLPFTSCLNTFSSFFKFLLCPCFFFPNILLEFFSQIMHIFNLIFLRGIDNWFYANHIMSVTFYFIRVLQDLEDYLCWSDSFLFKFLIVWKN